jgi:hypothetical protein
MKFSLTINDNVILLDQHNVDMLTDALDGCEMLEHKYMGRKTGGSGESEYLDLIRHKPLRELIKLSILSTTEYEAIKFITKQTDEANANANK